MNLRVGDVGRTQTACRPSGKVVINGETYSARCDRGDWISAKIEIIVIGQDAFGILIRPKSLVDSGSLPDYGRLLASNREMLAQREIIERHSLAEMDQQQEKAFWEELRVLFLPGIVVLLVASVIGWFWIGWMGVVFGMGIALLLQPMVWLLTKYFLK